MNRYPHRENGCEYSRDGYGNTNESQLKNGPLLIHHDQSRSGQQGDQRFPHPEDEGEV